MDEIVKQAMAKWPHVPHCYGWLGLDARGDWYLRDAATQAAGPFAQVKGERIEYFVQEQRVKASAGGAESGESRVQMVIQPRHAAPAVPSQDGADKAQQPPAEATPDGAP